MNTCSERLKKFVIGTTEWTVLPCELAEGHDGGHRTALPNGSEDYLTILSWFKKKDNQ